MTRAKYNKNPKLTREQWVGFYKQQNMQVSLLLCALEEAHKKIEILEGQLAQKIIEEEVVVVVEEEEEVEAVAAEAVEVEAVEAVAAVVAAVVAAAVVVAAVVGAVLAAVRRGAPAARCRSRRA